jgi:G:T-mismatch repair DNA endonuclease (very short patch repair protein)
MKFEDLQNISLCEETMSLHSNNHKRRKYVRSVLLDRELLEDVFLHKKMTVYQFDCFLKSIGLPGNSRSFCNELNIILPDAKESFLRSSNKRASTNIKKFGVENPLAGNSPSRYKRDQTVLLKYGVNNVFALQKVKEKIQQTCLDRYGSRNFATSKFCKSNNGLLSKPHKKVSDYLNSLGINHVNDKRGLFERYNEKLCRIYSPVPDIVVNDKNIVIEIFGDYFHANPKLYLSEDIITLTWKKPNKQILVKELWEFDEVRKQHIESFGYDVLILWESDIKNENYKNIINL